MCIRLYGNFLLFNCQDLILREQTQKNGGVAQLGEHLPCKQGVKGSIPFISTIFQGRTASGSGLKNSVDEGREKPNNSTLSS